MQRNCRERIKINLMNLVSIIIPVYNAEKYISETIASVLFQTYSNWELIIVDDGSTDDSLEIIKKIHVTDSRIKLISKNNSGVSDTRNVGILGSGGEFIAFLDADDVWMDNNLEEKVNYLISSNIDVVYSSCEIIDENSKSKNIFLSGSHHPILEDILLLKGNYITAPSGVVFKKNVFDSIGLFDENLSNNADQDIWIRTLAENYKIGLLNLVLWKYRMHGGNMSSNIRLLEKDSFYMFKKAQKNKIFKSFIFKQKCFSKMYLMLAGSWWKNGKNKKRGCYFLVKSFLSNPMVFFNNIK